MSAVSTYTECTIDHDIRELLSLEKAEKLDRDIVSRAWDGLPEDAPSLRDLARRVKFIYLKESEDGYKTQFAKFAHKRVAKAVEGKLQLPAFSNFLEPVDLPPVVYLYCMVSHLEAPSEGTWNYITGLINMDYHEIVPILYESGFDLNYQDANGNTLLHHAVRRGKQNCTRELLSYENIDVNIQNNFGNTPLHIVGRIYPNAIRRTIWSSLIHAGASLKIRNNAGKIPRSEDEDCSIL